MWVEFTCPFWQGHHHGIRDYVYIFFLIFSFCDMAEISVQDKPIRTNFISFKMVFHILLNVLFRIFSPQQWIVFLPEALNGYSPCLKKKIRKKGPGRWCFNQPVSMLKGIPSGCTKTFLTYFHLRNPRWLFSSPWEWELAPDCPVTL